MKANFEGYFEQGAESNGKLWEEPTIVFDANVLLNLYKFKEENLTNFLDTLGKIQDKLWLPHQVAYEYHKNRLKVISSQVKLYSSLEKAIDESLNKLRTTVENNVGKHHAFVNKNDILKNIAEAGESVKEYLKETKEKHPDLADNDSIREELISLYEDRVGPPYTEEEIDKLTSRIDLRYSRNIPPGYRDLKKQNPQEEGDKYGDALLWFQIMDYAATKTNPIIFVTEDMKPDWWLMIDDKPKGPRLELIQEINDKADVPFWMFTTGEFLRIAQDKFELGDQQDTIEQVEEIRTVESFQVQPDLEYLRRVGVNPVAQSLSEMGAKLSSALQAPNDELIRIAAAGTATGLSNLSEIISGGIAPSQITLSPEVYNALQMKPLSIPFFSQTGTFEPYQGAPIPEALRKEAAGVIRDEEEVAGKDDLQTSSGADEK